MDATCCYAVLCCCWPPVMAMGVEAAMAALPVSQSAPPSLAAASCRQYSNRGLGRLHKSYRNTRQRLCHKLSYRLRRQPERLYFYYRQHHRGFARSVPAFYAPCISSSLDNRRKIYATTGVVHTSDHGQNIVVDVTLATHCRPRVNRFEGIVPMMLFSKACFFF
jgi:hypothetical protein